MKPSIPPAFLRPASASRGMVLLVVTLSLVVLLTFVIVAFFAATTVNRTAENASSNAVGARILAEGAVSAIESELFNEIVAGSNSTTTGNLTLYTPKTAADMVPKRNGAVFVTPADANFLNVVKQSGLPFSTGAIVFGANSTSNVLSSNSSANGRKISPERWSAPMLTGGNFTAATAPRWIHVNTNGYSATATATTTIGRIAFNVYDVGGLLDVNAAGYGRSMSAELVATKGNPATIDLRVLPGIKATADMTNTSNSWPPTWRLRGRWEAFERNEKGEIGSLSFYNRSGWLEPFSKPNGFENDRMFTSRQDLIRFARAYPQTFDTNGGLIPALQYLTTFSRDLNQPSFAPEPVRPKVLPEQVASYSSNPAGMKEGNAFAYGYDDQVNLPFLQQRVAAPFTRYYLSKTGALQTTPAKVGEPLVLKRFPLSRLQLLADRNVVALPNSEIHRFFGLYRSSSNEPWRYNPDANSGGTPSSSSVLNLDEIQGREPNLFELLRAGIHWGSLGKSIGDTMAIVDSLDSVPNYQLAQIVASMIDQIDVDSFPTIIDMDGRGFYGSESLPYLTRIALLPKRSPFAGSQGTTAGIWIVPEIWNPYNPNSPTTGPAPSRFRFTADGAVAAYFKQGTGGASNWTTPLQPLTIGQRGIVFTERNLFSPLMLWKRGIAGAEPIFAADNSPAGQIVQGAAQAEMLGIYAGAIGRSGTDTSPYTTSVTTNGITLSPNTWVGHMGFGTGPEMITNLYLQYQDGTQWRTYASWKGWNRSFGETAHGAGAYLRHMSNFLDYNFQVGAVPDPRTFRFGVLGNPYAQFRNNGSPFDETLRPGTPDGARCGVAGTGNTRPFLPGLWTQNSDPTNAGDRIAHWKDTDGIQRKAMGAYASGTTGLAMADPESRPIILNRPFRSVAELSYVFRGAPWKNIDFFTKESGDSALLDIFCMEEDETPDAMVAGRVNLNTRQPKVIEALIAGAAKTYQATEPITALEVTRAATELTNWTATKPFKNPSELVGRPISATAYEGFSDKLSNVFSNQDAVHHHRRETVLRALSGTGTTRTWNVMIDVIAQSGKQTAGGFIVEGEYRTWTHLAIDRFTGKILDRISESVIE